MRCKAIVGVLAALLLLLVVSGAKGDSESKGLILADASSHSTGSSHGKGDSDSKGSSQGKKPTKTTKSDGDDDGDSKSKKGGRKRPTKTRKVEEEEDDSESDAERAYLKRVKADKDAGRMPGRMKMLVPPRTVHTPLFELDSVVELQWEYDNNVIEVPEKLMISVQMPRDPHADPRLKPVIYDIAVNVTGDRKKFYWDTKNDVPDGVGMREGSGYTMYFYDGEIGFRMSDVVPAGYLIKYAMPFAFFISRYDRTNDGVPKNYNPNAATHLAPAVAWSLLVVMVATFAVR